MQNIKWIIGFDDKKNRTIANKIFRENNVPLKNQFIDPVGEDFWKYVADKDLPLSGWDAAVVINLETKEVRLFT